MSINTKQAEEYMIKQKALGIKVFNFSIANEKVTLLEYYDTPDRDTVIIPSFTSSLLIGTFLYTFEGAKYVKNVQFEGGSELTDISSLFAKFQGTELNLNMNTSNIVSMSWMFENAGSIKYIDLGDRFDTTKVTHTNEMFAGCENLKKIDFGDKFDTRNNKNARMMFNNCKSITEIDLGDKFSADSLTDMRCMFAYCSNLKKVNFGKNFKYSDKCDSSLMFAGCNKIEEIQFGDHSIKVRGSKDAYEKFLKYLKEEL